MAWKFRSGIWHPILTRPLHSIPQRGFRIRLIDRNCLVLEDWLKEKAQCPNHTHNYKDPQKHPIYHHGDVLPVFNNLRKNQEEHRITSKTRNLLKYKVEKWQNTSDSEHYCFHTSKIQTQGCCNECVNQCSLTVNLKRWAAWWCSG